MVAFQRRVEGDQTPVDCRHTQLFEPIPIPRRAGRSRGGDNDLVSWFPSNRIAIEGDGDITDRRRSRNACPREFRSSAHIETPVVHDPQTHVRVENAVAAAPTNLCSRTRSNTIA